MSCAPKWDRVAGTPFRDRRSQRRRFGWRAVFVLEPEQESHSVLRSSREGEVGEWADDFVSLAILLLLILVFFWTAPWKLPPSEDGD